jgi:glycosyltransferase involved in cell wall biosynthesis
MSKEENERPFVSIGVTTYNRHDLLRQTLESVLAQTFTDFEVIVGNDYTSEVLTGEMLGIDDPRIRFVNHPRNLREVGNMNALMAMATGRYFTWLFDDDLYEPDFLLIAHDCLVKTGYPPVAFSSFRMLGAEEEFAPRRVFRGPVREFSGREFLRWYSGSDPQIASVFGLFDLTALRDSVGGLEEMCPSAIGVYSEYLFLVRCALLDRIVFFDAPLVIYRVHSGSWSESPHELEKYVEAGKELVKRCAEVLRHPSLVEDFSFNLMTICEQHLITIANRVAKIEVTEKKYGFFALCRAIARYRQEALSTRRAFADQGGEAGFRTRGGFLKIDLNSYRIILINLASCFYRNFKP